jgi:multidrug efflux pump subunit AcrA (membrane-fusion protein)
MVVIRSRNAMSRTLFPLLPLLIAPVIFADEAKEITVEPQPFTIRQEIAGSAMPAEFQPIAIDAKAWPDFEITSIAPHGAKVAKGDVLMAFDTEKIDERITDFRRANEAREREIAQATQDLARLEQTTPHKLESLRRAAAVAAEENAYFTATRRKAEEESADQRLKRAESFLENQREELRQLEMMYTADELTEETEEIILQRQRDRVEAAEFDLAMEKLRHKRTREVLLPREALQLADNERDTALALANFEADSPRAIAKTTHDLASLRITQERDQATLAKMEADRKLFEITAPADGWFYHGTIENGRWSVGETTKTLIPHGKPPVRRPLAAFIPADVKLDVVAHVDGAMARRIDGEAQAMAWLEGREDASFSVKLASLSPTPDAGGNYQAVFHAEWPEGLDVVPAAKLQIRLIAYHAPAALVLPAEALRFDPEGWTVAVKLADGDTERRAVTRGRVFDGKCEIVSGLEAGQVVVLP